MGCEQIAEKSEIQMNHTIGSILFNHIKQEVPLECGINFRIRVDPISVRY